MNAMTKTELERSDADVFRATVSAALGEALGDTALNLIALNRRGEGYSWETYIAGAQGSTEKTSAVQRFAVKREPTVGFLGEGWYDVQREVDLLNAARALGCPTPLVVTWRPGTPDQRGFYIMEFIEGLVPMAWDVKKMIPDLSTRRSLGLELAALFARLHRADVSKISIKGLSPAPLQPMLCGLDETEKWHATYLECAESRVPILDLAFAWLRYCGDAVTGAIALVHGDLRVGNVIVSQGKVAAILDWETATITDPAADLAVFNLPTFRGRSELASGLVEWPDFLQAYEEAGGIRPSDAALTYWSVLELVKGIIAAIRGVHYFRSGKVDDLRYGCMGWQTHHAIKWLVEMFESGKWGR